MKPYHVKDVMAIGATAALVTCTSALGQVSFTGLGHLGGGTSRAYGLSRDGIAVVGDSRDANSKTQAFVWTSSHGTKGIGFLNATYKDSHGRGVAIDSSGFIHATGYSSNASNKPQAIYWSGNRFGVGSFSGLPFLSDGDESRGLSLRLKSGTEEVYIVGEGEKAHGAFWHGFRWRSGGGSFDLQAIITGGSDAWDIAWRPSGAEVIVGTSNSNWWISGSGNHREGYRWTLDDAMVGEKGLDYVCGRGFQVAAGDNGTAETSAKSTDLQLIPVGTTGLNREEIIVSSGADMWLQTRWAGNQVMGDDLLRPEWRDADATSESVFRATSPDARFHVGRCTYPDETCGETHPKVRLFQANFFDVKLKDGEVPGHCNIVTHFPLGFLDNDNYSEAYGVSNASLPEPSREGTVVVGWSMHIGYRILAGPNGVADSTAQCDDIQERVPGTGGLSPTAVVVSSGPNSLLNSPWSGDDRIESYGVNGSQKRAFICFIHDSYDPFFFEPEMYDLKAYLEAHGLDLSGWELREARAVSEDGSVVTGWGLHNGVEEGWVATLAGSLGFTGACCHPDGSCTEELEYQCTDDWQGARTSCSSVTCCPVPWADVDHDGDVDQRDFAAFQACYTLGEADIPDGCSCLNRDGDNDIDLADFERFQACATGPAVILDVNDPPPGCTP